MRLLVLHDATGGRHRSSAARGTASREVLTRHVETEVTCWCVETINNTRLFSFIKFNKRTKTSLRKGPLIISAAIWRDREHFKGAGAEIFFF